MSLLLLLLELYSVAVVRNFFPYLLLLSFVNRKSTQQNKQIFIASMQCVVVVVVVSSHVDLYARPMFRNETWAHNT